MKRLVIRLVFLGLLTAISAFAEDAPSLDIARVNNSIATLLVPLVATDDVVASAGFVFNAQDTNIEENRVGFTLTTSLRQTGWSREPSRITTTIRAAANINSNVLVVGVNGEIRVQTEVLPFVNYLARAASALWECGAAANATLPLCERMTALERVASVEEIRQAAANLPTAEWLPEFQVTIAEREAVIRFRLELPGLMDVRSFNSFKRSIVRMLTRADSPNPRDTEELRSMISGLLLMQKSYTNM